MRHLFFKEIWITLATLVALSVLPGCQQFSGKGPVAEEVPVTTDPVPVQRTGMQMLLVSGLEPMEGSKDFGAYRNGNKTVFCLLLIIDEGQGKTSAIQLDPDTMVSFMAQGAKEPVEIPLSTVFSYGSGGSDSCLNQVSAVSGLLGGIFIDHYMTFTVDALSIVNDLMGGVTVPAADDLPNELSGLVQEGSLTLLGEQAAAYFTYRDDGDPSNEARMERQNLYMRGLYTPFLKNAGDNHFLTNLTMRLGDRLSTDLTLSQMVQMMDTLQACKPDGTVVQLDGITEKVDGAFQFRVDSDSLKRVLDTYFYS